MSQDPPTDRPEPDELDGWAIDEDDDAEDTPARSRRRGGYAMRHPLLLIVVFVASCWMMVAYWPRVAYILESREPAEFGVVSDRPGLREDAPDKLPPMIHNRFGRLQGTVEHAFWTPPDDGAATYFGKLSGDKIFVILTGEDPTVEKFRLRRGSLTGFDVDGTGRMINPAEEPQFARLGMQLRLKFQIPDTEQMWIFDTRDQPYGQGRWRAILAEAALAFTALLSLLGLLRMLMRARRASAA